MQEGLKIVVVGNDDDHDLSEVTNLFCRNGWTPRIERMTEEEWRLADVKPYLDQVSGMAYGAIPAAFRSLVENARYPITEGSDYVFHLNAVYRQIADSDDAGSYNQIVARQIIASYLHSDTSPLVAVVVSEHAWLWQETAEVWLDQFPANAYIWRMQPDGRLTRVVYGNVVAQELGATAVALAD